MQDIGVSREVKSVIRLIGEEGRNNISSFYSGCLDRKFEEYSNLDMALMSIDNGYVYAENKHTSTGRVYAGGICGTDGENATSVGAKSVTGNKNYGKVEVKATKSAAHTVFTTMPGAAAGGLFGLIARTENTVVAADNYNYGEVVATEAGADGPAGALAGASAIGAWSGNVGKNVKVNGVLWNTWTNEAAWLCPNAANAQHKFVLN